MGSDLPGETARFGHNLSRFWRERGEYIIELGFRQNPGAPGGGPMAYNFRMDGISLARLLADLPLGPLRFFAATGSTNDEAARWAQEGAPDLALVVADEQTAGRGRMRRRWFTPPGAALAFSLVLRPEGLAGAPRRPRQASAATGSGRSATTSPSIGALLAGLGALAVSDALGALGLEARIKWPNDVLVSGRKLAGMLAEARWEGEALAFVILGIGLNVTPASLPPEEELLFPATCVEAELGRPVERWALLHGVLAALLERRARLASPSFLRAWEERLAFRGQAVWVLVEGSDPLQGEVLGLDSGGALRLRTPSGGEITLQAGEVSLRPVDRR